MENRTKMKRRYSKQQRRTMILEAALICFAQKGYNGATTKDIAAQANVSEALLYKHFSNKMAIYKALNDFCTEEGGVVGSIIINQENSIFAFISSVYFLMYVVVFATPPKRKYKNFSHRLFAYSILEDGQLIERFHETSILPCIAAINQYYNYLKSQDNIVVTCASTQNLIWCVYSVAAMMTIFDLSDKHLAYEGNLKEAFHDAVIFSLRGLGLKEKIINEHYQSQKLEQYIEQLFEN
ncbi:TetR/AcrR family transcriptional regulator [Candidatus Uabimicrobium sp. HlEnr_7]|uniref:TetR/AcrR family transcriptional regulator n=1 Tax=Candidatus Uabimicrobium helgolandensis TaxID=3095367 RepID=UPI00355680FD